MSATNHARSGHRRSTRRSSRTERTSHGAHAAWSAWLDPLCLRLMDVGIAGCILAVPFLMGGRHPIGQVALVALTSLMVVAWAVRQTTSDEGRWRHTHAFWLLLLGLALVAFQLAPLPHSWLGRLSPHAVELLPLWTPGTADQLGVWSRISLTPEATRAGLILFLSYGLLFVMTVQRIERIEDVERILRWCALGAILMAGFGLVQYLTSNGRFFWFYEAPHASTDWAVTGSFTNKNHFAHFLALGIGPLIWWLLAHRRENDRQGGWLGLRRARPTLSAACNGVCAHSGRPGGRDAARVVVGHVLLASVVLVIVAATLSLSRGGATALFLAGTIAAVVCGRAAAVRGRFLLAAAAAGVLVIVSLNLFGFEAVSRRFSDLTSGSLERLDRLAGRRTVWAAVAGAIPDFAAFGSGVGSHREVCPVYLKSPIDGVVFTHAESGPLQVMLETGAVGASLVACGVVFCAVWCVGGLRAAKSSRQRACLGAICAALAANLAHTWVDFVWYVPACTAMVAILAALACRSWQLASPPERQVRAWRLSPAAAAVAGVAVVILSLGMTENRFRAAVARCYWDQSRLLVEAIASRETEQADAGAGAGAAAESRARSIDEEEQIAAALQSAVDWYPEDARAHLSLARSHLHLFDLRQMGSINPMPLAQVRDAMIASQDQFASRRARDEWLRRAFGQHCEHLEHARHHARLALAGCPVLGEGYLYLSELCFLDGAKPDSKWAYLDQAMLVRPFEGEVWTMASRETLQALLENDLQPWVKFARGVLRSGRANQKRELLEGPISCIPPEGLPSAMEFFVKELEPDIESLSILHRAGQKYGRPEQLRPFREYYARMAEYEARKCEGPGAASRWSLASDLYGELGDRVRSIECAQGAIAAGSGDLKVRYRLACLLLESGESDKAREHLEWCLRRSPDNVMFRRKHREAVRAVLDQQGRTAAHPTATAR